MNQIKPLLIAGACMLIGWVCLLLVTIRVLPQSLFLAFISYGLVMVGSIFGVYTLFQITKSRKYKD